MEKKLNLLISFLAVATGFIFYYTWHSNSGVDTQISKNKHESNTSNSLTNKVSIPKKETYETTNTTQENHPIKVHLTKERESKKFIEDDNISSIPIEQQQKHIAQTYNKLEPATYQEDVQEAEENFDELDVESREISQNLQNEMTDIEQ